MLKRSCGKYARYLESILGVLEEGYGVNIRERSCGISFGVLFRFYIEFFFFIEGWRVWRVGEG